ncbi:MAG TPA: hypothetical protein VGN51_03745 [Acidimicrobiia bacterium]
MQRDGGMIRFWTENSVYEVDQSHSLVRRLAGIRAASAHQGEDGRWQEYAEISEIEIGRPVLLTWGASEDGTVLRRTVTSVVVGETDGESGDPPNWVVELVESSRQRDGR